MRSESNLFQEYGDQPVLNERAVDSLPTQDKFKGKNSWSPNETENLSDVSFDSKKHLNCNAENPFSLLRKSLTRIQSDNVPFFHDFSADKRGSQEKYYRRVE